MGMDENIVGAVYCSDVLLLLIIIIVDVIITVIGISHHVQV